MADDPRKQHFPFCDIAADNDLTPIYEENATTDGQLPGIGYTKFCELVNEHFVAVLTWSDPKSKKKKKKLVEEYNPDYIDYALVDWQGLGECDEDEVGEKEKQEGRRFCSSSDEFVSQWTSFSKHLVDHVEDFIDRSD